MFIAGNSEPGHWNSVEWSGHQAMPVVPNPFLLQQYTFYPSTVSSFIFGKIFGLLQRFLISHGFIVRSNSMLSQRTLSSRLKQREISKPSQIVKRADLLLVKKGNYAFFEGIADREKTLTKQQRQQEGRSYWMRNRVDTSLPSTLLLIQLFWEVSCHLRKGEFILPIHLLPHYRDLLPWLYLRRSVDSPFHPKMRCQFSGLSTFNGTPLHCDIGIIYCLKIVHFPSLYVEKD